MIYGKTLDEGLGPEYYVQKLNNFPPPRKSSGTVPFSRKGRGGSLSFTPLFPKKAERMI
jgi:hypothetical protein